MKDYDHIPNKREKWNELKQNPYYNALQIYHQYVTPETGLFRGSEYVQYGHTLREGHPFFDDGHQQQGSIFYDRILYENVMILYDQVRQQVVINDPYEDYKLFLINEQIDISGMSRQFTRGPRPRDGPRLKLFFAQDLAQVLLRDA